ncbi:hypothetical protein IIA95_03025 [Patescibacteria group bacterium]|nr:hypothetical protein [Patescibacteria group bacterium]
MENIRTIVENIKTHDLVLGTLAGEALECSLDKRFMASLACLFILAEQSIKLASDVSSGNLNNQILKLKDEGIISSKEADVLNSLRRTRNKLFHESHYMWVIEDKDNNKTFFSEENAKEKIWNSLSLPVLQICKNLITSKH